MTRNLNRARLSTALGICTALFASGCKSGGCIELLAKKPVMKQPWAEWAVYPTHPNAVLDSLGPGQVHYSDTWSNAAFFSYRVTGQSGVVGYIVYDSLVRSCPHLPQ
jgi:hypothetical protein